VRRPDCQRLDCTQRYSIRVAAARATHSPARRSTRCSAMSVPAETRGGHDAPGIDPPSRPVPAHIGRRRRRPRNRNARRFVVATTPERTPAFDKEHRSSADGGQRFHGGGTRRDETQDHWIAVLCARPGTIGEEQDIERRAARQVVVRCDTNATPHGDGLATQR
jgi:hypothetical protein